MANTFYVISGIFIIGLLSSIPIINRYASPEKVSKDNSMDEGSFSVLSYNVAGLPELISKSHPIIFTKEISPKLNAYDIVNVQENFAYNNDLNSKLEFKYKTPFSGNVPFGDGLMTFSKYPLYMFDRVTWEKKHGFITDGADEMTPKGFTFTSLEIKPGYFIDVYNLHTDAENDEKSIESRNSNMEQISKYIKGISEGKAVIIFGDTNTLYTKVNDTFYDVLVKSCNLKDAWIENVKGGIYPQKGGDRGTELEQTWESIDKILYRSGKNVEINAISFQTLFTEFTDKNGNQLSDHYPVNAVFNYKIIEGIMTSDLFGQANGEGFSFIETIDNKYPLSVTFSVSDNKINRIGFTYNDNGLVTAGGTGGNETTYEFKNGEYITEMTISKKRNNLRSLYYISSINLKTNLNNEISGGDLIESEQNTFKAPDGYGIAGFFGYSKDVIHKLGCIYQKI